MSNLNLYNMNKHININDTPFLSWKGKTLTQITGIIRQNVNTQTYSGSLTNLYKANPIKLYRREIASNLDNSNCNMRISSSINEFDRPGGSIVSVNAETNAKGLANTLDMTLLNNASDIPGQCNSCVNITTTTGSNMNVPSNFVVPINVNSNKSVAKSWSNTPKSGYNSSPATYGFSPAQNALKRTRSAGMIKRRFDVNTNKPVYYTDTREYLKSRNKTQQQNEYHFLVSGDSSTTPGTNAALNNSYASNGTTSCSSTLSRPEVSYKPKNTGFAQQGAVSASSLINKIKYQSMSNSSLIYRRTDVLGASVANAMSYGITDKQQIYTQKDVLGYPNISIPKINKYDGSVQKCADTMIYRRG